MEEESWHDDVRYNVMQCNVMLCCGYLLLFVSHHIIQFTGEEAVCETRGVKVDYKERTEQNRNN